ncbi:hypothetical protein LTS18_014853, partial [Coniosporium uncinatum]
GSSTSSAKVRAAAFETDAYLYYCNTSCSRFQTLRTHRSAAVTVTLRGRSEEAEAAPTVHRSPRTRHKAKYTLIRETIIFRPRLDLPGLHARQPSRPPPVRRLRRRKAPAMPPGEPTAAGTGTEPICARAAETETADAESGLELPSVRYFHGAQLLDVLVLRDDEDVFVGGKKTDVGFFKGAIGNRFLGT